MTGVPTSLHSHTTEARATAAHANYPTVWVTRSLLDRTGALLASFARLRPHEGVVYWFGLELGRHAVVTTLVVPNAISDRFGVRTSPEENAAVVTAIADTPLVLLGQAHSHPLSDVRHSAVDDAETFASFDGAVSVVVPHFGRRGVCVPRCGVYRHLNGAFRPIPAPELRRHLCELPVELDLRPRSARRNDRER